MSSTTNQTKSFNGPWTSYYERLKDAIEPHKTAQQAFEYFTESEKILTVADLGCGTGRDTLFFLTKGCEVYAVDAEEEAIHIVNNRAYSKNLPQPFGLICRFQDLELPTPVDLMSCSLSLPFIHSVDFQETIDNLLNQIKDNGRFAGHFFGPNHQWAQDPDMTFLSEKEIKSLFSDRFDIEWFHRKQEPTQTANQGIQFWDQIDIIARKLPEHEISDQPLNTYETPLFKQQSQSNSNLQDLCQKSNNAITNDTVYTLTATNR